MTGCTLERLFSARLKILEISSRDEIYSATVVIFYLIMEKVAFQDLVWASFLFHCNHAYSAWVYPIMNQSYSALIKHVGYQITYILSTSFD